MIFLKKKDCSQNCSTCYGGNENECLSCLNDEFLEGGSCVTDCTVGNYPDINNICQRKLFFKKNC